MRRNHVRAFVDRSIDYLRSCDLLRHPPVPGAPEEMRDPTVIPNEHGVGWKPVPSTVTDLDLAELEGEIGGRYPPAYRHFLQYKHFYELLGPVEFFPHPVGAWKPFLLQTYRNDLSPERLVGRGLVPFADEVFEDAGFVCFDTRAAGRDGDCPVVLWDRRKVGGAEEVRPMFSSAERMFRALLFEVEQDIPFMRIRIGEGPERRARKRELMAGFLAQDPEGAGGVGRGYWTAGGIEPAEG